MATIPYVRNTTWADGSGGGTPISAAKLNVLENGIYEVSYAPAVRVTHNANQSITSSSLTALAMNTERFDQAANAADTQHDTVTNNSRLTAKYAGIYSIKGCVSVAAGSTGIRELSIRHQGSTMIDVMKVINNGASENVVLKVACHYSMAVNEYVELMFWHTQGSALNVLSSGNYSPEFSMVRVA